MLLFQLHQGTAEEVPPPNMFYNLDQKPSIFTAKPSMARKFMCTFWQCIQWNQNSQKPSFFHYGKFQIFVPFFPPCNLLFEETGSFALWILHRLGFANCNPWCCLTCLSNYLPNYLNCFCKNKLPHISYFGYPELQFVQ